MAAEAAEASASLPRLEVVADERSSGTPAARAPWWPRLLSGAVAIGLIVLAIGMPVWQASLSAPQYPDGLSLKAWGSGKVVGDIAEINELNHYVGMKAFSTADVPETKLWVPSMLLAILGAVLATVARRPRWLHGVLLAGMWLVPFGVLADVQFRLWEYGHSVQADAAIRIDPFTPLVVGPTKVLNFTTWSYPGLGTGLLFLAAAVLTFGPGLLERLRPTSDREGR